MAEWMTLRPAHMVNQIFRYAPLRYAINTTPPWRPSQPCTTSALLCSATARGFGHKYIYDFEELGFVAGLGGFTKENGCSITRASYLEGRSKELAERDAPVHRDESVYVELTCSRQLAHGARCF